MQSVYFTLNFRNSNNIKDGMQEKRCGITTFEGLKGHSGIHRNEEAETCSPSDMWTGQGSISPPERDTPRRPQTEHRPKTYLKGLPRTCGGPLEGLTGSNP